MTEDHPIEYADFEGIIPEGLYGAGTVMIWDKGTYETEGGSAPEDQLRSGELKVELRGKRLGGAFVLVHRGHRSGTPRENSWLLIKRKDQWANPSWKADTTGMDRSATGGRTFGRNCAHSSFSKKGGVGRLAYERDDGGSFKKTRFRSRGFWRCSGQTVEGQHEIR
jgi:ATP-dependent DNA ligase